VPENFQTVSPGSWVNSLCATLKPLDTSRGNCQSTADGKRKKCTHSFLLPVYSAPGGLPQAPGRAA
jgi:hypothetical protein